MDRFHAMAVFVAVAEEGGFAAAGRRLNLSPPQVSRAVADLEARIGARLLHRTTRTVRLSPAGDRFLADCKRILAELHEAEATAAGLHGNPRGPVALTASVLFGRMILAPLLGPFLDRYPEVSLSGVFVDRIVHLVDEGFDVAVRIADLPDSGLAAVRVGSVRRVVCAAPAYLARRDAPATPAALLGHDIILFSHLAPAGGWTFADDGRPVTVHPPARLTVNGADVAVAAALAGRGLARVLSYMIADDVAAGRLVTVLDGCGLPPMPVHVIHKEGSRASARVRALVDYLVVELRRHPALDR